MACREHPLVKEARSEPTTHRKTKRNQTSQHLLAEALNHNPITVGIRLLGPDPSAAWLEFGGKSSYFSTEEGTDLKIHPHAWRTVVDTPRDARTGILSL